jgi:hypothetical protein
MSTSIFDKTSSTKDTDGDGIPDIQDPAPNDPTIPAKSDTSGVISALGGITGGASSTTSVPMDEETARETRRLGAVVPSTNTTSATMPTLTPTATGKGGSGRSVSKSYRTYTKQEVLGLATSAFQSAIGRAATDKELEVLTKHINTAEKANPSKTVTTSSGGTSKSKTTGGIDEQQFATSAAESNPEYAGYQKATTYFDAMLSALRGQAGGGI